MAEHRVRADELIAEYRRSKDRLELVERDLAAITNSASSADGLVKATVGARGTLAELHISAETYRRYSPTELAEQIVRTVAAAATGAITHAQTVLAPALTSDGDGRALLTVGGSPFPSKFATGVSEPPRGRPVVPRRPRDDGSFAEQSWVDEPVWSAS